jgi:hypothetical protein
MSMTETDKDQDLMSTLGNNNRIVNLKKGRLHDLRSVQAIFNTFYFQKLAEEAGYMLDSKSHTTMKIEERSGLTTMDTQ